jgi:cell division septum initiation protein DivIVA
LRTKVTIIEKRIDALTEDKEKLEQENKKLERRIKGLEQEKAELKHRKLVEDLRTKVTI